MKKWIVVPMLFTLFGCANNIQLATPDNHYDELRHISDERSNSTSSNLISSNQLKTAVDILLAGPYGAGSYQYEAANMSPLSDGNFSVPLVLALDMKFDELFRIPGQKASIVHLRKFIVRSKEKFLGRGPLEDRADCEIELTYMDTPFRIYDETGLSSYRYEKSLGGFVNRCIRSIVGQVGDHNRRNNLTTN